MGAKKAKFRLKKTWGRVVFGLFLLLGIGIYLYVGLQPIRVDASEQVRLEIAKIDLFTPVERLERLGNTLIAPEVVAGEYQEMAGRSLVIGHSSTVFKRLSEVELGDSLVYDGVTYRVSERRILAKSEVDMTELVRADGKNSLILMTCIGESLGGDDYTHRLVIKALVE